MDDLIKRLEELDGPNFAIECEITERLLPTEWFGVKVESWFNHGTHFGCNTADGMRHFDCVKIQPYTTSLDAALTLVPVGWKWQVNSVGVASVWPLKQSHCALSGEHFADNPALALCIAALRARTQEGG